MQNTHEMPSRIRSCQHRPRLLSAVQALVRYPMMSHAVRVGTRSGCLRRRLSNRYSALKKGARVSDTFLSRGCHAPFHHCEIYMRERSEDKGSICARPIFHSDVRCDALMLGSARTALGRWRGVYRVLICRFHALSRPRYWGWSRWSMSDSSGLIRKSMGRAHRLCGLRGAPLRPTARRASFSSGSSTTRTARFDLHDRDL
jgi:hypothetical protein